jgi:diaminopimelate decarboxylase
VKTVTAPGEPTETRTTNRYRVSFQQRLFPILREIADYFGTPFHIYDEVGIRQTGQALLDAFAPLAGFREYFAVKALPNPEILRIMRDMGFGFDCSSVPELILSRGIGASGDDIMFTSNNTTADEFRAALDQGGCILNLDDPSLLDKLDPMPERLCFRYTPNPLPFSNAIIGNPAEAKFGISREQLFEAYRWALKVGVKRFGLHAMVISNELNYHHIVQTARLLFDTAEALAQQLTIQVEFVNIGGGLGIPYRPDEVPLDLRAMAAELCAVVDAFKTTNGYAPRLFMESGRYMTGPHGVLVTKVINRKDTYRTYLGVDASMSALMRPAMYKAYHHIDILNKAPGENDEVVDVVGSLCENNDKFAVQRSLPHPQVGDLLIIHDTGAHGHAMGFNYNGRLRPKELLLAVDGSVRLIRREEVPADYFATLDFKPKSYNA